MPACGFKHKGADETMRTFLVFCSFVCLLLIGCNSKLSNTSNTSNSSSSTPNSNNASRPGANGDFSTPKAAVETFISAGSNRDAALLSQCFHPDSPGEFRKLREKTSSARDLDELAGFVEGATVGDVDEKGDKAVVKVAFKKRNEEISMKKSEGDWKILDF